MIDNVNPTSQFHPYQPQSSTPRSGGVNSGGLSGILNKLGVDRSKIDALGGRLSNVSVRDSAIKARQVARNNGGLVLGGLAALAIGAGLMRRRSLAHR